MPALTESLEIRKRPPSHGTALGAPWHAALPFASRDMLHAASAAFVCCMFGAVAVPDQVDEDFALDRPCAHERSSPASLEPPPTAHTPTPFAQAHSSSDVHKAPTAGWAHFGPYADPLLQRSAHQTRAVWRPARLHTPACTLPLAHSRLRTPACTLPLAHSRLRHSRLHTPACFATLAHSRLHTPACAAHTEREQRGGRPARRGAAAVVCRLASERGDGEDGAGAHRQVRAVDLRRGVQRDVEDRAGGPPRRATV